MIPVFRVYVCFSIAYLVHHPIHILISDLRSN